MMWPHNEAVLNVRHLCVLTEPSNLTSKLSIAFLAHVPHMSHRNAENQWGTGEERAPGSQNRLAGGLSGGQTKVEPRLCPSLVGETSW